MRSGATGIFPAFYAVKVAKDTHRGTFQRRANRPVISQLIPLYRVCSFSSVQNDGWTEQFAVRFLGSVHVPMHKGNDVLCAAMQKVIKHGHCTATHALSRKLPFRDSDNLGGHTHLQLRAVFHKC